MIENYYYEYKRWSIFWGLMLDQQKEVQKILNKYNQEGWKVVQFEWNSTKEGLFKNILVFLITVFSFGFISYWTGFSIVFEKVNGNLEVRTASSSQAVYSAPKPTQKANTESLFD